nr:hypothetical protein [Tanacetum cinerariifolium]
TELHDDPGYPVSTVEAATDYVDTKFCSNHDPVLVVSLARKTIQDAEKFEQWADLLHLFQTPDVRVPPSDR